MAGRPTSAEPSKNVPQVGQRVVISQVASGQPIRVSCDQLVTRFERHFLRAAGQNDGDIVLSRAYLEWIAEMTWNIHPNV